MRRVLFAVLTLLPLAVLTTACPETKQASEAKSCCDQPQIPAKVASFKVVADDVQGPSDGQIVKMKAVLYQPIERQDLYPVLHTLYAWSLTRTAFEPIEFRAEVFATQAAADAGKDPVAYIERPRGQNGPVCENAIPWSFKQSVERAFEASLNRAPAENSLDTCKLDTPKVVERIDKGFVHQPKLALNIDSRSAQIEFPFLTEGKDEFDPKISFNKAMTYWIEFTTSMFRRAPDLKTFKFIGVHNDAPVATISVDRNTFENNLTALQEEVASHAAVTFQKLGMNATNDKAAEKEQNTFRSQLFHDALKALPAGQVTLVKSLK